MTESQEVNPEVGLASNEGLKRRLNLQGELETYPKTMMKKTMTIAAIIVAKEGITHEIAGGRRRKAMVMWRPQEAKT